MTSQEIQKLVNTFIALKYEAEYEGCDDPFRSFWQGFDLAVELGLKAIGEIAKGQDIREPIVKKGKDFETETYRRAQNRLNRDVANWVGRQ